jgi:hypothetical protein
MARIAHISSSCSAARSARNNNDVFAPAEAVSLSSYVTTAQENMPAAGPVADEGGDPGEDCSINVPGTCFLPLHTE